MAKIKLSEQHQNGKFKTFKKFIYGKMFYLSADREVAILKAVAYEAKAMVLKSQGLPWTEEAIAAALSEAGIRSTASTGPSESLSAAEAPSTLSRPATPQIAPKSKSGLTVHEALDKFIAALTGNRDDKEFGQGNFSSLVGRLECIRFLFADENTIKFFQLPEADQKLIENKPIWTDNPPLTNMPLKQVGENELAIMKSFLISRPTSRQRKTKISAQTVSNNLQAIGRFFKFSKKKLGWTGFDDWQDVFRFKRNQKRNMMTLDEKSDKASKDHMTYDDIERYWKYSRSRTKCYSGLAFWCAWTQMELSDFRKVEFYRDKNGQAFIDKTRSKTGEIGKWWIPEPVAQLVEEFMATTPDDPTLNPNGLAFMTENNMPLVHHGADGKSSKSDLIGNYLWKPVQFYSNTLCGRSHSFKWFRKTMPNMVGELTNNKFIAKAALSQKVSDVADTHYLNPLIEASIEATKQLWETGPKGVGKGLKVIYENNYQKEQEQAKAAQSAWLRVKHGRPAKQLEAVPA